MSEGSLIDSAEIRCMMMRNPLIDVHSSDIRPAATQSDICSSIRLNVCSPLLSYSTLTLSAQNQRARWTWRPSQVNNTSVHVLSVYRFNRSSTWWNILLFDILIVKSCDLGFFDNPCLRVCCLCLICSIRSTIFHHALRCVLGPWEVQYFQ